MAFRRLSPWRKEIRWGLVRWPLSCCEALEVLLNPGSQHSCFLVQFREFGVNIAQGLFKIEILIHFPQGVTDVATGSETPFGGFDLGAGHGAAESGYCRELGVREAGEEPIGLSLEVGGELELIDGFLAARVEVLRQASDGAGVPCVVGAGVGVLFGGVHYARGALADEVDVFDGSTARGGEGREFGEEFFLGGEGRASFARLGRLAIGPQAAKLPLQYRAIQQARATLSRSVASWRMGESAGSVSRNCAVASEREV